MKRLIGLAAVAAASLIAGCGGGGGSAGTVSAEYEITLRADKMQLPLNINGTGPGKGVNAPFTTVLHVSATVGGAPIPGGENIFGCNVAGGLNNGSLYYLDGDPDHETEVDDGNGGKIKVPNAYRSITLGSNAGGNSFHFHAGNAAGTSRITCSVTDPRDKQQKSASVDIVVGGGSGTGRAASVVGVAQAPGVLGTQLNTQNLRTNIAIEASIWDDANQPVPDPSAPNLQVELMPYYAYDGARLLAGAQSGSTLQVATRGGVGQFALLSGPNDGFLVLRLLADRGDNNVANGIQDPIVSYLVVEAVDTAVVTSPLVFAATSINVTNAVPAAHVLAASGGKAPYTWAPLDPLPNGLSLGSSGIISGTPLVTPGSYVVRVRVTDSAGATVTSPVTIVVTGAIPTTPPLVFTAPTISTTVNQAMSYALIAQGGKAPLTWAVLGTATMPAGLTFGTDGVISGTPTAVGSYILAVRVTDAEGTSVTQNVTITVKAATP